MTKISRPFHGRGAQALLLLLAIAVLAAGCNNGNGPTKQHSEPVAHLTIGSKAYTEQIILLKLLSIYLKEKGYAVTEVPNMTSSVVRSALEEGHVDLYWEYTGTALMLYHQRAAESDVHSAYRMIHNLDRDVGLTWLAQTQVNSTYVLLMRRDRANDLGIASTSDLREHINQHNPGFLFASSGEFLERVDGLEGLQQHYGFRFQPDNISKMDTNLIYTALRDDQVDVISGIATDGRISKYNLLALEDDLNFFPAYTAVPVVRTELLQRQTELKALINAIPPLLDTATIKEMTYLVDVERQDVFEVVRAWLYKNKLL